MIEINPTKERDAALKALKISRGQIDGIIRMVEDGRYCIDVANQLMATQSLLRKAELAILQGHLRNCVREACIARQPDEKIEELNRILEKIIAK